VSPNGFNSGAARAFWTHAKARRREEEGFFDVEQHVLDKKQLCRPELGSGPMPQCGRETGGIKIMIASEAWMLKQVQHDGRSYFSLRAGE
jgi:hypothetical protein